MAKQLLRIVWSAQAFFDLKGIHQRISEDLSTKRADDYVNGLHEEVEKLKKNPGLYSPCRNEKLRKAGWRCLNYRHQYILIYEVDNMDVIIIAILPSRKSPKAFEALLD